MSSLIDSELLDYENLLLNLQKQPTTSNYFSETAMIPSRLAPVLDVLDQSVRARKRISPQDTVRGNFQSMRDHEVFFGIRKECDSEDEPGLLNKPGIREMRTKQTESVPLRSIETKKKDVKISEWG